MNSKYDIGDTILLRATITGIEQCNNGQVIYKLRNSELPVLEQNVVARIADGGGVGEETIGQAENIFKRPYTSFVKRLFLIKDGTIVKILERN